MPPTYFVVLDSGTWVYNTHLLRSPLGKALLRVVARSQGTVGLPQVVEAEVTKLAQTAAAEAITKAEPHRALLYGLTDRSDFRPITIAPDLAATRIQQIGSLITRLPYRDAHGREAMTRVIAEIPPNSPKNQQYKDTLIWLALLEASGTAPVHFITTDKGFFSAGDYSRGLAPLLEQDASQSSNPIHMYSGIGDCLRSLTATLQAIDLTVYRQGVMNLIHSSFSKEVDNRQGAYGEIIDLRGSGFATEDPQVIALDLFATVKSEFATPQGERIAGRTEFHLTAYANVTDHVVSAPVLEEVRYFDGDGRHLFANLFLRVSDTARLTDGAIPPRSRLPLD